jgi:DNA-binding MarR family transcriptional regulator
MDEQYGIECPIDKMIIRNLRFCAGFLRHHTGERGGQRRVLRSLCERGAMTQRELLEEMGVRPSSLSELLGKLEIKGFVIKEKSTADKRNYNVAITGDGILELEEMRTQYEASMSGLLSGLEENEKIALAALLEKLRFQWSE